MSKIELVAEGKHLRLMSRDGWEFVQRRRGAHVVIVAALTSQDRVLFVEQYRAPVDKRVIELPAGLVGDDPGRESEPAEEAARRELLEETGYQAAEVRSMQVAASSAGLTDELVTFCVAEGLTKAAEGGGVASEAIQVHEVPRAQVDTWLDAQVQAGRIIGARIGTGLYLLQRLLSEKA